MAVGGMKEISGPCQTHIAAGVLVPVMDRVFTMHEIVPGSCLNIHSLAPRHLRRCNHIVDGGGDCSVRLDSSSCINMSAMLSQREEWIPIRLKMDLNIGNYTIDYENGNDCFARSCDGVVHCRGHDSEAAGAIYNGGFLKCSFMT